MILDKLNSSSIATVFPIAIAIAIATTTRHPHRTNLTELILLVCPTAVFPIQV